MRSGQISKQGHGNFSSISLAKILINEIENILVVFMHRYSKKQYSTNTVLKRERERAKIVDVCTKDVREKEKSKTDKSNSMAYPKTRKKKVGLFAA